MSDSEEIVNLEFLREFCRNDRKKMSGYIDSFLESLPEQMAAIKSAYTQKNMEEFRAAVHSLKPQVKFIGLLKVSELISSIENETALPTVNEATLADLMQQLDDNLSNATTELAHSL